MFQLLKDFIPNKIKKNLWETIDKIKIFIGPYIIPNVNLDEFSKNISNIKIAFVKQVNATDLYSNSDLINAELVFSSFHRSGAVALFTKFDTSFFIVNVEKDEECNYWKFRLNDCGGPEIDVFEKYKNELIYNKSGELINFKPQKDYAISVEEIDWSKFKLVISCDIAIPERIIKEFPKVKWAYMFFEPAIRGYQWSHKNPLHGYDFFLNQKYRTIKLNPKPKYHEIDFPYHLHYYGVFHDLLNIPLSYYKKEGVFLENRTATSLTNEEKKQLKNYGTLRFPEEELLENVIYKQLKSKYFFSLRRGVRSRIWGNGIIEAVACGCLAFGNPNEYANKDLFTTFTSIKTIEEFTKKVNILEKNEKKYNYELKKQRKLINYLCFYRPMKELINK